MIDFAKSVCTKCVVSKQVIQPQVIHEGGFRKGE